MTLRTAGCLAALICAATYLVGFALLVTVLAPLGFGTGEIDDDAVVAFIAERPGILIAWNTAIYIVNAFALLVLVVVLHRHVASSAPDAAAPIGAMGVIWAGLVLAAGMIANVTVEQVHALAAEPEAAVMLWRTLHGVELGLGGGNEIAGGAWIAGVSLVAARARVFGRPLAALGALSGAAGLVTFLPALGDIAGTVFGLGAIAWFLWVGAHLLRRPASACAEGIAT